MVRTPAPSARTPTVWTVSTTTPESDVGPATLKPKPTPETRRSRSVTPSPAVVRIAPNSAPLASVMVVAVVQAPWRVTAESSVSEPSCSPAESISVSPSAATARASAIVANGVAIVPSPPAAAIGST